MKRVPQAGDFYEETNALKPFRTLLFLVGFTRNGEAVLEDKNGEFKIVSNLNELHYLSPRNCSTCIHKYTIWDQREGSFDKCDIPKGKPCEWEAKDKTIKYVPEE